jgi:uncharacterized membrane protein (UPF0127 family)
MQLRNRAADSLHWGGRLILAILVIGVVGAGCRGETNGHVIATDIPFRPDGLLDFRRPDGSAVVRLAIEVAESDSAQARGLMDRRSLPKLGGMLFVDSAPSQREFWMRSTPLPLDIIFIRADHTIANIAKRTTPYSEARIRSEGPAQYVLEVRAGFTDQYAITDSLTVEWTIQP